MTTTRVTVQEMREVMAVLPLCEQVITDTWRVLLYDPVNPLPRATMMAHPREQRAVVFWKARASDGSMTWELRL